MRRVESVKKTIQIFSSFALILLVSGCATLGKEECLNADWRVIGFEDGANGQTPERIGKHRKACAKHGVAPDMAAYNEGRDDGLKQFCRPQRGFVHGVDGREYGGVCPPDLETDFLAAYQEGRKIYSVKRKISLHKTKLNDKVEKLKETKEKIKNNESLIVNSDTPPHTRAALLSETKELSKDQGTIETEISEIKQDIARLEGEVTELLRNSGYN